MKDYNRAETKVLKPDAARISADKSAYSPSKSKASGASETGSSAKLGDRGSSGNKSRHHRYGGVFGTALVVLLTFSMIFASVLGAFADDLTNTVPTDETPGGASTFYSNTINTGLGADGPDGARPYLGYGPDYGPYTVDGVYQSQSTTSPTSFAAGLPLGTVFIDQSMIPEKGGVTKVISTTNAISAGLQVDSSNRVVYNGNNSDAITILPGKINELQGDLVKVTFASAAVLPDGERADLVITYSNARIVVDQRYAYAPDGNTWYEVKKWEETSYVDNLPNMSATSESINGRTIFKDPYGILYSRETYNTTTYRYRRVHEVSSEPANSQPTGLTDTSEKVKYDGKEYTVYTAGGKKYIKPDNEQYYQGGVALVMGNAISYGGTDTLNFQPNASEISAGIASPTWGKYAETQVSNYLSTNYGGNTLSNSNAKSPVVGLTIDATYQIVKKDGTPAPGTFVFGVCGINLDRDPDVGGGNNLCKPLWYSYNSNFGGVDGTVHSYFSEAMEITDGQVSQNVYVRPNTQQEDNPAKITGVKGQYFWPNVSLTDDNHIKFIANAVNLPNISGNDNSYNAGFVTLANAPEGFKVTATGHGTTAAGMNSLVFNSKQIWYRYTSSTGPHGKIETTSEGNYGGDLSDGGDVLGPTGYYDESKNTRKKATSVVAEGKTVTYTMTPDIGYKLKTIKLGTTLNPNYNPNLPDSDPNSEEYILDEVKFTDPYGQQLPVSSMKKGDSLTVQTRAGHEGILTYEKNGTYTFKYVYAEENERIHVEWEPVSADLLVSKIWDDEDDKDGMRKLAYESGNIPKFRLEYSVNGGRSWDVVKNNYKDDPYRCTIRL